MPSSKFEADLTLLSLSRRATFSLFPLMSSCTNDYLHVDAIIYFLTQPCILDTRGNTIVK